MSSYLLIILIFLFKVNASYTQIITITQKGRTIIPPANPNSQTVVVSFSYKKSGTKDKFGSSQKKESQNEIDFERILVLKSNKIFSLPLSGMLYVTSGFGERYHPIYHKEIFHDGIDLKADYEIVKTIANGFIAKQGYDERAGNYLIIQHGNGIESIYCHLSKFLCSPDDLVFAGDVIAISGATGAVTAPHLHFAIKKDGRFIDPLPVLKAIISHDRLQY